MQLEKAGRSWGNYGGYAFHFIAELAAHGNNHSRDLFLHHAAAGKLPSVSWVYGDGRPSLTEHPTQNVTDGMNCPFEHVNPILQVSLHYKPPIFINLHS